jgi:RNAse (barnase) inhibitor barstar
MNNIIELDVSPIKDETELHHYLFKAFRFPEYYGNNWDAFDECINDISRPIVIMVNGFTQLLEQVPRGAKLLKVCLTDYAERYPELVQVNIS